MYARRSMADRDQIVGFLNDLLRIEEYPDGLPVGLQVPGTAEVRRVATGVSASLELFQRTAEASAQMLIVHHGLFFGHGPRPPLSEADKARLRTLFDHDISLLAYHLALDAHPEVGNNAVICRLLGLTGLEPFGRHGPNTIGFAGSYAEPVALDDLVDRVRSEISPQPLLLGRGPDTIRRVAVISGGAAEFVAPAAEAGADAYVTGEPSEQMKWAADESGIHVIAAGHYATEVFGVRELGDLVAERFGVEHVFVDVPNPV
jgi:dinuclear metal center YbgI/SA1388 family protein